MARKAREVPGVESGTGVLTSLIAYVVQEMRDLGLTIKEIGECFYRLVQPANREELKAIVGLMAEPVLSLRALQFRPFKDEEVPVRLADLLAKWRKMAEELEYSGPVAWLVPKGFTIKKHAPKLGPCRKDFQYLQDWDFPDDPTERVLVFWIPRVIPESNAKTATKQLALLKGWRERFSLPEHHLAGFGKVGLLAGLILCHFKHSQEKVPLNGQWVRTDTLSVGGVRLGLGAFFGSLGCDYWGWNDESRHESLWVFALGVETLKPGELEDLEPLVA